VSAVAPLAHRPRAGLARLVEVQYVTTQPENEWMTLYIITDRGRLTLANATAIDDLISTTVTPGNFGLSARTCYVCAIVMLVVS
jgi:hypothetical protein